MITFASTGDEAARPRRRRLRRILSRVLIVLGILCVGLIVAAVVAVRTLPTLAAREIGRLTNTRVRMGTFDFDRDGSILIEALIVRPRGDETLSDSTILRAGNVHARFSRRSLLLFSPRITELQIEDFFVEVQRDLDTGRWNVSGLEFNPSRGDGQGRMPEIRLHRGQLRYSRVSNGELSIVTSIPVEARLGRSPLGGCEFEIWTATQAVGYGQSRLEGRWRKGELTVSGGLASTNIPSLERAWAIDTLAADLRYDRHGEYTLRASLKGLHGKQTPQTDSEQIVDPRTGKVDPISSLLRFLDRYRPTGVVESISATARGNLTRLHESELTGTLVCEDISICDRRFPYTIDHLSGEVAFTESSVHVKELMGRHGPVDIRISGWTKGLDRNRTYQYLVTSDNMILDEALYAALEPKQKKLWEAFQPCGMIGVDYRMLRNSPVDRRMQVSVDLKGVTARYRAFPYPLTDLTGRLYFDRDSVIAGDLVSELGGRRIQIDGKVTGHGSTEPLYFIAIKADDIPLDSTLDESLPPQYRRLYEQLEADGTVDVASRVFSTGDANDVGPISFFADISCERSRLKLAQLPFALSDVNAQASVTPDSLTIKTLEGRYEESPVSLTGSVWFDPNGRTQHYHMNILAEEMPLNDTMLGMLPKSAAEPVAAFRPEGDIDLAVEVRGRSDGRLPDYVLTVECLGNGIDHEQFSYPLQDVRGTIVASRDRIELKGLTARPAAPSEATVASDLRIDGTLGLANGRLADGALSVAISDLVFSEALGNALPEGLAGLYRELSPRGPFDLDLPDLGITVPAEDEKVVEFDGTVNLKTCELRFSGAGAEICGRLHATGSFSTKHGLRDGQVRLAAERFAVRGKAATDLNIEATYDPEGRTWTAENFLADFYDGKVLGGLEVRPTGPGAMAYVLRVALNRVNLQQFLATGKDPAAERNYTSGLMNASLNLEGRAGTESSRVGTCQVRINDMQVGKVSSLANLVSVLSLGRTTEYTFERMLIDAYIRRDRLLIRHLDLSGQNAAFTGAGSMNLATDEVDLMLTGRGQRPATKEPSILQSLTEGLGGGVVRIEVTGKAADPHIETKALPLIEDSLKILGTPE